LCLIFFFYFFLFFCLSSVGPLNLKTGTTTCDLQSFAFSKDVAL